MRWPAATAVFGLLGAGEWVEPWPMAACRDCDRRVEPGWAVSEEHLRRLMVQGRDPATGAPLGLPYFRHKTVEERAAAKVGQLGPELSRGNQAAVERRLV